MDIKTIDDACFLQYGRVITDVDVSELIDKMQNTPLPDDVIYIPSDNDLESTKVCRIFSDSVYGQMPIQIGYCNGHNTKLNALEYHRSSEINVAVTDMILILGKQQDITEDYTYDTSLAEAFMVPKGTILEVYATTLHYAPCGVDGQGFRCVVVLPKGTNYDRKPQTTTKEDKLLAATNKWLIAHEEAAIEGAFNGLIGENLSV